MRKTQKEIWCYLTQSLKSLILQLLWWQCVTRAFYLQVLILGVKIWSITCRIKGVQQLLHTDCECSGHPKSSYPNDSWASAHQKVKVRIRGGFRCLFWKMHYLYIPTLIECTKLPLNSSRAGNTETKQQNQINTAGRWWASRTHLKANKRRESRLWKLFSSNTALQLTLQFNKLSVDEIDLIGRRASVTQTRLGSETRVLESRVGRKSNK